MKRRAALAVAVVSLFTSARQAQAQELSQVMDQLVTAWARNDAQAIASFASRSGVQISIGGDPIGPLPFRQVAAAFRRLFEEQETVAIHASLAQIVGGAPDRAFGELTWFVKARGTTIPEHATIFVALVREKEGWRVTQIRLLR